MADAPDSLSADRRANWVGLRTLRQRPAVVGTTEQGETVYEIRSVQLLLSSGANHFSQLVHCSKCGRAMSGRSVVTPADLDRPPNPMFCGRCSAGPAPTMPTARPAVAPPEVVEPVPVERPDESRVAVLEAQLAVVFSQLRTVAIADSERADLSEAVAALRAEVRQLVEERAEGTRRLSEVEEAVRQPASDDVEASVRRLLAEADAATEAKLDAHARRIQATAGEALAQGGSRLDALAQAQAEGNQRVAELAERVERLAAAGEVLAQAQPEVNQRVAELAERVERLAAREPDEDLALLRAELEAQDQRSKDAAAHQATLEDRFRALGEQTAAQLQRLARVQAGVDEGLRSSGGVHDAAVEQLGEAFSEGQLELRAEVAALARRVDEQSAALAAQLDAHRRDAGTEVQEVAQETLTALAEPLRALTSAHEEIEQRLASLTSWASGAAARQDALEQKLSEASADLRRLAESPPAKKGTPRARRSDRVPLLDSLEEQLRAAEERLGQH